MKIVLPVYSGDIHLALLNLEVCRLLDPIGTRHHALIAAEEGTKTDALVDAASKYFAHVTLWKYPSHSGDKSWPRPQNHAWQSVARHMASVQHPDSWFWWEADVTPLISGWLDSLEAEHQLGGKPFTGRIGDNGMGGVAIYPPCLHEHTMDALLCRASSFDSTLWKDIRHKTHPANHLMGHFARYSRIKVHINDPEVPRILRSKGYVVFHGCNDGSLAELILNRKPSNPSYVLVRIFGKEDIDADQDGTEPMWQYDAFELIKRGYPVLPFKDCTKDYPPITTQALDKGWQAGIFSLPLDASQAHYNAGLVRTPEGLALVTRRWLRSPNGTWKSDLVKWSLDADFIPSDPRPLMIIPRDGSATYEDPRIVAYDGRYWISYCVWRQNRIFRSHQAMTSFSSTWNPLATINVPYGGNGWQTCSGSGHEKNWVWFRHGEVWHFVYQAHPHVVVRVDAPGKLTEYKPKPSESIQWSYGEIHGGTPPVRVGDEFITFFHSSLAWKGRRKRYYMGAYAFSAKPPFQMTRLIREPLLRGSDNDTRILGGPLVVFPCGALLEDGEWLITGGLNDEASLWAKIAHSDIDRLLKSL